MRFEDATEGALVRSPPATLVLPRAVSDPLTDRGDGFVGKRQGDRSRPSLGPLPEAEPAGAPGGPWGRAAVGSCRHPMTGQTPYESGFGWSNTAAPGRRPADLEGGVAAKTGDHPPRAHHTTTTSHHICRRLEGTTLSPPHAPAAPPPVATMCVVHMSPGIPRRAEISEKNGRVAYTGLAT